MVGTSPIIFTFLGSDCQHTCHDARALASCEPAHPPCSFARVGHMGTWFQLWVQRRWNVNGCGPCQLLPRGRSALLPDCIHCVTFLTFILCDDFPSSHSVILAALLVNEFFFHLFFYFISFHFFLFCHHVALCFSFIFISTSVMFVVSTASARCGRPKF